MDKLTPEESNDLQICWNCNKPLESYHRIEYTMIYWAAERWVVPYHYPECPEGVIKSVV